MAHGHACRIVLRFKIMEHLDVIRLFIQYEAQGLPHSGLGDAVFPIETTCVDGFRLCLIACLHSFLRRRPPPRTILVTNIPSSLEIVDQTSNGCSRWRFCTVTSMKPFLNISKGQSIESPTSFRLPPIKRQKLALSQKLLETSRAPCTS